MQFVYKIITHIVKALLTLLTSWPSVVLFVVWLFRKTIRKTFDKLSDTSEITIYGVKIKLNDPNIPQELKIFLFDRYIRTNDIREALKILSNIRKVLENHCWLVKERKSASEIGISTKQLVTALEEFINIIKIIDKPELTNRLKVIYMIIADLREVPESIQQNLFPSVKALQKFDDSWHDKNPSQFQFLIEIEEVLLEMLRKINDHNNINRPTK